MEKHKKLNAIDSKIEEIKEFYKNNPELKKFSKIFDNKEKIWLYLEIRAIIILLYFTLNNYLWDFIFDQDPKNPEKTKIDSLIETINYQSLDYSSSFSLYNIEFEKQIIEIIKNKREVNPEDFSNILGNCDTLSSKEFSWLISNFSSRNTRRPNSNEDLITYFQKRLKQKINKFSLVHIKKKVKDDICEHC